MTCMWFALSAGIKTALKLHSDYVSWSTREDPRQFLDNVGKDHEWCNEPGTPAHDFREKFNRNCRLFKFFPVFRVHVEGRDKRDDLYNGRWSVSMDTYLPTRRRGRTIEHTLHHLFGQTFTLSDELRTRATDCAKMRCWAGGQSLSFPPLPVITGIGAVPYHAACDFASRPPKLWPPSDLREYLRARHLNVRACVCVRVRACVCVIMTCVRVACVCVCVRVRVCAS